MGFFPHSHTYVQIIELILSDKTIILGISFNDFFLMLLMLNMRCFLTMCDFLNIQFDFRSKLIKSCYLVVD